LFDKKQAIPKSSPVFRVVRVQGVNRENVCGDYYTTDQEVIAYI